MVTTLCRSPVLTIDCSSNKRSFGEEDPVDDFVYQTPPLTWHKKRCTDEHFFSPPPPPRGKCSTARHFFVFQEQDVADIMLPELAKPLPVVPDQENLTADVKPLVRLQYRRPPSPDIILPLPISQPKRINRLPLAPVLEEEEEDSALMPPPLPPKKRSLKDGHDHHHHDRENHPANGWCRPNLPDAPTRAGTEYARCA
ncbi:expressed unknown protein [Seminavis robusta]|uniref:Uncharacterized protein n=1 Tax=Seminavis robusta TaxID=568900 RepID=A0A9N8E263_9STRA|nr:expressed unknown protein [Seminavis robusta]|eukprot:Sro432_g141580.1 n/a (198) ;mRNA; f:3607-4200